jgi:hypothetical protein
MFGTSFPAGTGIHVQSGSKLITQIHYYTTDAPGEVDRDSRILLQLSDTVERPARMLMLGITNPDGTYPHIKLEPGETKTYTGKHALEPMFAQLKAKAGTDREFTGVQVHSANLHMHATGDSTKAWLERSDGSEEMLLEIPRWELHWQRDFFLTEPKSFKKDELASTFMGHSCTFKNTRDEVVNGGVGTEDEMCLNFAYLSLDP